VFEEHLENMNQPPEVVASHPEIIDLIDHPPSTVLEEHVENMNQPPEVVASHPESTDLADHPPSTVFEEHRLPTFRERVQMADKLWAPSEAGAPLIAQMDSAALNITPEERLVIEQTDAMVQGHMILHEPVDSSVPPNPRMEVDAAVVDTSLPETQPSEIISAQQEELSEHTTGPEVAVPPPITETSPTRNRGGGAIDWDDTDVDLALLEDIPALLRSLRLQKYASNFEDVKWEDLVAMSGADLEDKGVASLGARRRMLNALEVFRTKKRSQSSDG
jgi:hypothetical protein